MNKTSCIPRPALIALAFSLATLVAPGALWAKSCKLLAQQKTPCAVLPAERAAAALGVAPASLKVEDNVRIMGFSPTLTSCIYSIASGGEVRVGQFARISAAQFEQRYRPQSESEIAAGMPAGKALAEKAVGGPLTAGQQATGQAGAAAIVRGMQYENVTGLGDRARVMYSGGGNNAHLVTQVGEEIFFVQANLSKGTRQANLAQARKVAEAVIAGCR